MEGAGYPPIKNFDKLPYNGVQLSPSVTMEIYEDHTRRIPDQSRSYVMAALQREEKYPDGDSLSLVDAELAYESAAYRAYQADMEAYKKLDVQTKRVLHFRYLRDRVNKAVE